MFRAQRPNVTVVPSFALCLSPASSVINHQSSSFTRESSSLKSHLPSNEGSYITTQRGCSPVQTPFLHVRDWSPTSLYSLLHPKVTWPPWFLFRLSIKPCQGSPGFEHDPPLPALPKASTIVTEEEEKGEDGQDDREENENRFGVKKRATTKRNTPRKGGVFCPIFCVFPFLPLSVLFFCHVLLSISNQILLRLFSLWNLCVHVGFKHLQVRTKLSDRCTMR